MLIVVIFIKYGCVYNTSRKIQQIYYTILLVN